MAALTIFQHIPLFYHVKGASWWILSIFSVPSPTIPTNLCYLYNIPPTVCPPPHLLHVFPTLNRGELALLMDL